MTAGQLLTLTGYGQRPVSLGTWQPQDWTEYLHYLYLPIRMPEVRNASEIRVPDRLQFAFGVAADACAEFNPERYYVYLSAKRCVVSPGNPGNRPGWHSDDFGGEDINVIWADCYPTRFLIGPPGGFTVPDDDAAALALFQAVGDAPDQFGCHIEEGGPGELLRLDQTVVHAVPEIPAPGGIRSFLKISISDRRYDMQGNSHNYLFDYRWPMTARTDIRNHQTAGRQ